MKKQLAVPHKLRDAVLKSSHDALTAGHYGIERTYEAIRMKYYWPYLFKDTKVYCQTCEPCQRTKRYIHLGKQNYNLSQWAMSSPVCIWTS